MECKNFLGSSQRVVAAKTLKVLSRTTAKGRLSAHARRRKAVSEVSIEKAGSELLEVQEGFLPGDIVCDRAVDKMLESLSFLGCKKLEALGRETEIVQESDSFANIELMVRHMFMPEIKSRFPTASTTSLREMQAFTLSHLKPTTKADITRLLKKICPARHMYHIKVDDAQRKHAEKLSLANATKGFARVLINYKKQRKH